MIVHFYLSPGAGNMGSRLNENRPSQGDTAASILARVVRLPSRANNPNMKECAYAAGKIQTQRWPARSAGYTSPLKVRFG
jgi:hypothetical protein